MKILKKYKYLITLLLFIALLTYIIFIKQNLNNNETNLTEEILIPIDKEEVKEEKCTVDIKGAITVPGVYEINCDKYIKDVIDLAGGLTDEADTSVTNLAKKLTNEMVIIIYTREEVKNSNVVDTVVKVVEKECTCPNIKNDGCLNTEITSNIGENNLININNASLEELTKITGIGESKAKSIIEYREKNGLFKNIEDILNVDGIGNNLYEQIKIYITT